MAPQCVNCWKLGYHYETKTRPVTPTSVNVWIERESLPSGVRAALVQNDTGLLAAVQGQRAVNNEIDCFVRVRSEGEERMWEPRYARDEEEDEAKYVNRVRMVTLEERVCPYFEKYVPSLLLKDQIALSQKAETDAVASRIKAEAISRQLRILAQSLDSIRNLGPPLRGLEFQHLMRNLFDIYGLQAKESIVLAGEQIDLTFEPMGLTKIVVETKWLSEPVGATDVREFHGKLESRSPRVIGMYVSMSGFTEPAIEFARSSLQRRLIILVGASEIENLFGGAVNLFSLLEEKIARAEERREPI